MFSLLVAVGLVPAACTASWTASPVEAVVNLLKDLKTKVDQDAEDEQQVYNKFACWCENAMKAKADAIDKARADIRSTGQTILKLKGKVATLTSEIDDLESDMAANKKMQDEATALREKENGEYAAETDETKQALAAITSAVKALIAGTEKKSLLQVSSHSSSMRAVKALLEILPRKTRTPPQKIALLSEFMSGSSQQQYAPQSFTIQGILKDMYDTFSTDLESATNKEATANRDFETLIGTKTKEYKEMDAAKASRTEKKVEAEADLSDATDMYDKTEATKESDTKFFDTTAQTCKDKSDEWTTRKKMRSEELDGIKKTIEILTSDEAREIFDESSTTFIQVSSAGSLLMPAGRAYALLKTQAQQLHSLRLAQVALSVRQSQRGHFDEVIKEIDEMIKTVKEEGDSDFKKKKQCLDLYHDLAQDSNKLNWKMKNNKAKIDKLDTKIENSKAEKSSTIDEIKDANKQIDDMTVKREEENQAYLKAKEADKKTIALLQKAKDALSAFYKKHAEFLQRQGKEPEFERSEFSAPTADFSDKGSHKTQAGGIVGMLEVLIEEVKDETAAEKAKEVKTQKDFEASIKALKDMVSDLTDKKISLKGMISEKNEDKTAEEGDLKDNKDELKSTKDHKAQIKPDCDWIIKSFDERAEKRTAELSGLSGAKDLLAGAAQASLMQHQL